MAKSTISVIKDTRLLLYLFTVIVAMASAYFVLQMDMFAKADENLQKQVDTKVDKVEYIECIKRIEKGQAELKEDIKEIKNTQTRVEEKVDKILMR